MTLKDTMANLEALGNEKIRQMNKRNGSDDNQFGVARGDLRAVAKPIKINKALAMELWATGNFDARMLATLILNPKQLTLSEIEALVETVNFAHLADWVNTYIVKLHPDIEQVRERWMQSDNPFVARAGWSLTAGRVARAPEGLNLSVILERIEKEMPDAPSDVQWTMNNTLAGIGINHPKHREQALALGEKMGIYRDYPVHKGCTSPFAPIWINEMVKRQD